jgi:predicted TPR repeat methyltransferase
MNRSNRHFDPSDEFPSDEGEGLSREAIERANKVRRAIEAGLRFHRRGELRYAADIYYHVLELHPDQADALHLLGLISYQSGESESALRLVARASTSDPNNPIFHISRGDILQALGRLPGAVEAYREGLALDPELPEGYNNCGNALHAQRKFDEAATFYQHAIAIKPDYSAAHNNLGNVRRDQGLIEESIASFETALRFTPDYATVHNNLGNALRDAGRIEEAISSHRRALTLEPDFAEAYYNLGNALCEVEILDEAVNSYRQAVAIRPDFADAYFNLGNALRDDGFEEQAVEAYRDAVGVRPSHADAHNNLANILKDLGRLDDAKFHFRIAFKLDPTSSNAAHMLAALEGRTTELAPRDYVEELFDRCASVFESRLVGELEYQAPEHLHASVMKARPERFAAALDLGCGTGLVAVKFGEAVDDWYGVDLSSAMIVEAAAKGIYEGLYVDDIVDFLAVGARAVGRFDLITAADLFIYLGNLGPAFAAVRRRIAPDGKFAFSIENTRDADYVLCPTGRYAHGRDYIFRLADKFGFDIETCDDVTLRREHGQPIAGMVFVLTTRP